MGERTRSGPKHSRCLCDVGCKGTHQCRGQAVVRLEPQLLQATSDRRHLTGRGTGLDDGGNKRREFGRRPALILGKLGVDEIEAVERMLRVLDPAVHVNPAPSAGIALNGRVGIYDLELLGVISHAQLVARHHGDLREQRALGFPAFGASAYVIVRALTRDAHLDGIACAFALQRATRKLRGARFDAFISGGMDGDLCHEMPSQPRPTKLLEPLTSRQCSPEAVLAADFKRRIERRALRYYSFVDEEENRHETRAAVALEKAKPLRRPERPHGRPFAGARHCSRPCSGKASPTFGRLERNDVRWSRPARRQGQCLTLMAQDGRMAAGSENLKGNGRPNRLSALTDNLRNRHLHTRPIARGVRLTNACRFDILQPGRSAEDHAIKNSASLSRLSAARPVRGRSLRAAAWVACETENRMLSAIVLIGSATLHDCTIDNARVVMRLPAEYGSPAACLMHAQEVMAQTSISRALGVDDRVKITCLQH